VTLVVESRKGAVALRRWANGSVSLPRSSNRTYGFAASGFPTDFVVGTRQQPTGAAFALPSSLFGRLLIVIGVCRLAPITSILAFFASASEVRGLCSAGITRPQRSYAPVRLPLKAAIPRMTFEACAPP